VDFPGDVVAGYVTRVAAAAFQQSEFNPIATTNTPITAHENRFRSDIANQWVIDNRQGAGLSAQYVSSLEARR
jgi:hypothetical protein